ncbi:MAG: metal ABC transporter permease, partial [Clostridia bacterium]|nr:metal ABC transporter permease [Clostridia bacterium]MBO6127010.1 metal ABC transporter permease [Clostridia bacterium]
MSDFFIGDILSINKNEILGLLFLIFLVSLFWIFMFNKFLISSLNKDLATSKLINFRFYKIIFM